jgi:hypothetical protein
MNLIDTPIVYFVYNRPDLTLKSFDIIKELKPRILFIISDGPKTSNDLSDVKKVRKIVSSITLLPKAFNISSSPPHLRLCLSCRLIHPGDNLREGF